MGYRVHASDGDIGKVDEASNAVDESSIVVDTGPWIFGRKVILPAGTIQRVDDADERSTSISRRPRSRIRQNSMMPPLTIPPIETGSGTYYGEFYR